MKPFNIIFFLPSIILPFSNCQARYFQQEIKYTIHVSLNDQKHELTALETIIYKNNSPVTLNEIFFHLWPAAYKNKNTILAKEIFLSGDNRMFVAKESDLGTIDSLDFRVNGEEVKWHFLEDTVDVCKVILNKPLFSGESISISTPFRVKIPSAFLSRLGHSKQAYYITQWYPKPAVFDENGWNYFPYLDQGEYYSEFGSFDVYITLPENYRLAATGVMVNEAKENAWLTMLDSITRTIKFFPDSDSIPTSSKLFKQIHFHQDGIHDFAWFADKRWHVLKSSIRLTPFNKNITSWSFFNNKEALYWMKSPGYIQDAIQYFSDQVSEYPYDQITMVDVGNAAGNGMEYPMIGTIGNFGNPFKLEIGILKNAGHNWFYGIPGNNERYHPWLAEGINKFYEKRYLNSKYKNDSTFQKEKNNLVLINAITLIKTTFNRKQQNYENIRGARQNSDQASNYHTDKMSIQNYLSNVYDKTAINLDYLKLYLGDSLFNECMKNYFNEWKFKHPQPDDMKFIFENTSGNKLDWFFSDLLQSTKKLDYKLACVKKRGINSVDLQIKNTGNINSPLPLYEIKNNSIISTRWIEGFSGKININLPCENCDKYTIDANEVMPEFYRSNNIIRMNGLFRKTEKPILFFGISPDKKTNTFIAFSPVVGWNNYNKLMAGIVFHNNSLNEKKIEYRFMPLFATGTKNLQGGGELRCHFYPENINLYKITVRTGVSSYAFAHDEYHTQDFVFQYTDVLQFKKIDSRAILTFKQKNKQDHFSNEITLRNILVSRDIPYFIKYKKENKNILYWQVDYKRNNSTPLKKSLQKLTITISNNFLLGTGEMANFFTYDEMKKGLNIRIFGGVISLPDKSPYGIDYRMSLNGRNGSSDYLFDEIFLGRSEEKGILSQQFVNDYAGFKTPTSFYRLAEKWMFGFNTSTTLPGKIPFRLFINTGVFDNSDNNGSYEKISWEIGVDLPLIKDIFVISLPFLYSKDIQYAIDKQDFKTGNLIRFELHLKMLNPLDMIKTIYAE